jgi:presenilin-like A22 family membrane protease
MVSFIHIKLALLYFVAVLIGVSVIPTYIDLQTSAQTGTTTINDESYVVAPPVVQNESYSFLYIIGGLLIGTALLLLLLTFAKIWIIKLWMLLATVIALTVAIYPFTREAVPSIIVPICISLILGLIAFFSRFTIANAIVQLFMYAGIAALFVPMLNLTAAIIMLIVVSLYDIYMVHGSKKMVYMAKAQLSQNMFAGLTVGKAQEIHTITKENAIRTPKKTMSQHMSTQTTFAAVGGGDIAFPLLFAGAAMKVYGTTTIGYAIATGATLGLLALFTFAKKNTFHPAMPYVSIGAFVALGLNSMFL